MTIFVVCGLTDLVVVWLVVLAKNPISGRCQVIISTAAKDTRDSIVLCGDSLSGAAEVEIEFAFKN